MKGRLWRDFLAAEGGEVAAGAALLGARFGLSLDGGEVPWTWPVLRRLWAALAVLPKAAVTRNPHLVRLARCRGEGAGAYHGAPTRSPLGPGSAEIGVRRLHAPAREHVLPLDLFSATVHHEVGHAVAARIDLYRTLYTQVPHSPWVFQGDASALLGRLFADGDDDAALLGAIYLAQQPRRSLHRAFAALRRRRPRASRAILDLPAVRHLAGGSAHAIPAYHGLPRPHRGLIYLYDSGYRRGFICRQAVRRTRISAYALRSPDEWFAELYAAYYAGVEDGQRPGARLSRRSAELAEIADWLRRRRL